MSPQHNTRKMAQNGIETSKALPYIFILKRINNDCHERFSSNYKKNSKLWDKIIIRKVVITAAGIGTRLLTVTKEQPKEMLPLFAQSTNDSLCV